MLSRTKHSYPNETLSIESCADSNHLGKMACLHFMKWLDKNENKLIALATGSTPRPFFDWLKYYSQTGKQHELKKYGISSRCFQNLKTMHLVQLDEYFPLPPENEESFHYLIKNEYLKILKIPLKQTLLIDFFSIDKRVGKLFPNGSISPLDTSKLSAEQAKLAQKLKAYCLEYENKIQSLGGIQFFLGGLGPDGHIAFNQIGTSHSSITHLCKLQHFSAAYAAKTFGGYSYAKNMTVMTIGLKTITRVKSCFSIILVSGKNKAKILNESILSNPCKKYPLTAFQENKNTLVLADKKALSLLPFRRNWGFSKSSNKSHRAYLLESCLSQKTPISKISSKDLKKLPQYDKFQKTLQNSFSSLKKESESFLQEIFIRGNDLFKNQNVLHTGPHHDDIYLAYYPLLNSLKEQSIFYFTSAHRGVSNAFIEDMAHKAHERLANRPYQKGSKLVALNRFLDAYFEIANQNNPLLHLKKISQGKGEVPFIKKLKSRLREKESEAIWNDHNVYHFRSKIYESKSEKIFAMEKERLRSFLEKHAFDAITAVCDPFDIGPSAHGEYFKLLADVLLSFPNSKRPKLYAYRNVWSHLPLFEASAAVTIHLDGFESLFKRAYTSQVAPEYPSPFHKENFAYIAKETFSRQLNELNTLLGRKKRSSLKGVIYFKEMTSRELLSYLKKGDF